MLIFSPLVNSLQFTTSEKNPLVDFNCFINYSQPVNCYVDLFTTRINHNINKLSNFTTINGYDRNKGR